MKVIYVAGPFRGKPHTNQWSQWSNIFNAASLALELWKAGYAVICPHMNTAFFQGAAEDDLWLKGDLELLKRCDAVLLTPDWATSVGATAEMEFAVKEGIPVYYDVETLRSFE